MASFQLSPAVTVKEEDLTNIIPAVATSIGAAVIDAQWGPINEIMLIDSVDKLVEVFGQPVTRNAKDWFSARNFLAYSKDLRVIRVADDSLIANATNLQSAVANYTGNIFVKNSTDFDTQESSFVVGDDATNPVTDSEANRHDGTAGANPLSIVAKYAGAKGNDFTVSYADFNGFTAATPWAYAGQFDFAPTEDSGEFALVVLDKNGVMLEKFFCSALAGTVDDSGNTMYAPSMINQGSKYINIVGENFLGGDQPTVAAAIIATTWTLNSWDISGSGAQGISLLGGVDNSYVSYDADFRDDYQDGWDIFAADESVDINLLIGGSADGTLGKYIIENVAEIRKDCIAFVSPHQEDVVNNATPATAITDRRNGTGSATSNNLNTASSYGFMDGNYKYQYDAYNEVYRWLPLNGDIAGLAAQTDATNDPWWSFGGLNRGRVKNVVKLGFYPSKAQRDELYKNSVNPVTSFPGDGTVLFGDRTMLKRPSAFRAVNVRRLFITLEKAIATAARFALFEFNDDFTRNRFVQQTEPFLRDVQSRRGIAIDQGEDGFEVIADERVNTPEVINNQEFRARILVKPARSINFIELTFTAVNNGVDFDEIIVPAT